MNKIFKVIYNKTKHCYVVVSELAKSHCKSTTESHTTRNKTALTAAVLLALEMVTFTAVPTVQATDSLFSNDYVGTNYKKDDGKSYSESETKNYHGAGAQGVGSNTLGMNAIAGKNTITIGDRDASAAQESIYIGTKYDANNQVHPSSGIEVVSVGYGSDAAGTGSIAIGSGAAADTFDNAGSGKNPDKSSQSIAIGYNAKAKQNNIAIGAGSVATDAASKDAAYLTGQTAVSSYVSVGGTVTTTDKTTNKTTTTTTLRRLTNVADGAAASDVATVGQLQALSDKVGVYDAGFGIKIDSNTASKTNTISLNRNLGKDYDSTDGVNLKNDTAGTSLILGGRVEKGNSTGGQTVTGDYGALGKDSVTVGGIDNTVATTGDAAVVVGGIYNKAVGKTSAVVGGSANDAIGNESSVFGGFNNDATGLYATISGGSYNRTYGEAASVFGGSMNNAVGSTSSVFGGSINTANGIWSSVVGGSHNTTLGLSSTAVGGENAIVDGTNSVGIAGGSTKSDNALAAGNKATVTVNNGTAIGYQATANKEGTVAFGHDKGDVYYTSTWPQKATEKDGKYYDADNKEITEAQYEALRNADTTFNDYSQKPTVTENKYGSAAYNRLVKVADGVDDHDVVVMEQLNKAKTDLTSDLSVNAGWGINVADVTTKNDDGTETTTKNVISLNRNLGTNYGNPWKGEGKVTFEAGGENSLILGGAASILFHNEADDVKAGAYGKDSVLVGGFNNLIEVNKDDIYKIQTGEDSVIVGGDTNTVTGQKSVIVGGYKNKATGDHSMISGGASNEATGAESSVFGGQQNTASGLYASVFGGDQNEASEEWSSAIGGTTNTASGLYAVTLGGENNVAKGQAATIVGGAQNMAIGEWSLAAGGGKNTSYGDGAYTAGGMHNMAYGNASVALGGMNSNVNAKFSTGIAGGSTGEKAFTALAAGYQSVVTDSGVEWRKSTQEDVDIVKQGLPWSGVTYTELQEPYTIYVLDKISTAVGYQATADAPGVIAFGHDKGDVASIAKKWKQKATMEIGDDYSAKFYDANHNEIKAEEYYKLENTDGTWNDYTQAPIGTEEKTYQSAYYNRLVKAADGIDAHDAVVMEQLKPYTKSDASNIGSNLKTYTVGDDGETITEAEASDAAKTANENAWGAALGTGKVADPKATGAEKNGSQQLVTGGTVFNETRISAKDQKGQAKTYNYLDVNNSAGKNLEALDSALKTVSTTAGAHTALTVEGNTPAGTQDEKTKEDIYAGKNILLHESTDATTGKVTYDLKLSNDIMIGNKGKDGVSIIGPQGEAGKDGIDGKVGISGKDGKDAVSISGKDGVGHIGLTGPAGTNGMNGADGQPGTSIDITVKNGYDGKTGTDGKDGVKGEKGVDGTSLTRIVYTDKTGEHQVATMEDGLKFKGDDGKEIAKKLNNTLEIIGGAKGDLTENNIGVNSKDGKLEVQLAKDLKGITSISNQKTEGDKTTGAKITLGSDGTTTITGGDVNVGGNKVTNIKSALDGAKDAEGKDATIATATGDALKNAANLGDLQKVYNDVNAKADKASASHTALTVEGGTPAGTQDEKTKQDVYAGKNILLHESKDKDGKVTYDLKLSKDINIGKPGKDGEDGKIGIDGKDGHIGLNGSDGITVRGLDGKDGAPGKDGVTITGPKGEAGKDGIDGKVGISGKDGKDAVSISGKDGVGHIGLTGPAGTNGMNGADGQPGTSIDITVKNGYDGKTGTDGKDGVKGEKGVDGTSLTRIVYTDKTGEHQVATMEDGLKFKGDDGKEIAKKLNNTLEIIGGANGDLTDGNIGVNSKDGKLKVQLSKDLTGMNSTTYTTTTGEGESATTSTTVVNGNGMTITNGPSITKDGINGGGDKITHVGSGIEKDGEGNITNASKTNAANIGDVQNMVNEAVNSAADTTNKALAGKANIDASNIGANLKGEDGKTPASDAEKTDNKDAWGKAIGTDKIEANNDQLVTSKAVYNEVRPTQDGNYVKTNQTTGENLSALDSKIGKLDESKTYNYIDSGKDVSISDNLTKLDTQVKKNADDITNINKSISSLDQNAVKYDDSSKSKITLGGEGGTTITNVKDGALNDNSTDAVNGRQLNAVQKQVTNNTNEITKIKNGEGFTDAGKTVIKKLSQDAVQIKAGTAITIDSKVDENTGNKTYTISANNNGTVAKGNGNLISGDTLYKEVHVDQDGSYIRSGNTVVQNLSALDSGLKTTSDLIHTNTKGDTIQIGGNSTATKIDVSGKDKDGNTTGRVITGIVTDGKDLTSAANVGYVNGITSANTQQIYRDMNNAYSRLDTNINRAAAGSNALAALHPLDFDPADKASFAVGYGHYHNANAAAIGAFYQPNANTMVNMGISLGNGDPGFNAGVSFKLGKGSAYNGVSKAEMAQTIHDQAEEISAIKANDAAKDKRIDALEKENQEMKKQIQEILSRLNG